MGVMTRFEFATASRIIFGPGETRRIGSLASEFGKKALLVTGSSRRGVEAISAYLDEQDIDSVIFHVVNEPTLQLVQSGVEFALNNEVGFVVGIGGGSVLDAGKAIAALATNPGEVIDYLEVVGKAKPLSVSPLPYIAIPTTAGTGSEVTRNAVLGVPEQGLKVSMRSALMLPRIALVDPELTESMPPNLTASTGMDALSQLIEPFVSAQANPLTDAICRQGIELISKSLRIAYREGGNLQARQEMAVASLFGGLALANAKLGAVHGFAGMLGGKFSAPHGAICARLLPEVMAVNIKALFERDSQNEAIGKYQKLAEILTNDPNASIQDSFVWIEALCEDLNFPGLTTYGIAESHFEDVIANAQKSSSMKGNPIRLTEQEMQDILLRSLVDY